EHGQHLARSCRHAAHQASAAVGRAGAEAPHQNALPARFLRAATALRHHARPSAAPNARILQSHGTEPLTADATLLEVRDGTTGTVVADRLRVAATHWRRLRGLLGTSELATGAGLWLMPCRQIHMFGMRYAIDAVFLDAEHRVVETIAALLPGTTSPRVPGTVSVLELPAGTVARTGLRAGAHLAFRGGSVPSAEPSRRVRAAGAITGNVLLATLYFLFALQHIAFARRTGDWATTMPLVLQESILVMLFLTRRRSTATSQRPLDWMVGI